MKDPRFELVVGDAYAWILNCEETFDCVIMDISDPIEAGPGIMLYTKELYEHVATVLSPNGVFVTQAGNADAVPPPHVNAGAHDTTCFGPIRNTLKEVFSCVLPYTMNIPSFGSDWGYVMAYNNSSGSSSSDEWKSMSPENIDKLIEQYISGGETSLRMYDGITHLRMFHLPKGKTTNYSLYQCRAYGTCVFLSGLFDIWSMEGAVHRIYREYNIIAHWDHYCFWRSNRIFPFFTNKTNAPNSCSEATCRR